MSLRRSLARAAAAMVVAVLAVVGASTARAADPITIAISDLNATGSDASGVLTLRSMSTVQANAASVRAYVDGQERAVKVVQSPKVDRRVMLVIDTSGSMGASGMATVRRAVATFLRTAPADVRVGVATFASTAGVDLRPTLDKAAVQRVVDGLAARGDTSLYAGMRAAAGALGATGDRSIVLLSDGADTVAPNRDSALKSTVSALKASGVRTDVVQFKTEDPDAVAAIRAFARANGGSLVSASDSAGVSAAFATSARALDTQVRFTIEGGEGLTGQHVIRLEGTASGTPFTFERPVVFAAAAAPAPVTGDALGASDRAVASNPALAPLTVPGTTPWLLWVAVALLALALFGLTWTVLTPTLQSRKELRVQSIETYVAGTRIRSRSEDSVAQARATEQIVAMADRFMEGRKSAKGTMALIERADLPFRSGEWFIMQAVAAVVGAMIAFLLLHGSIPSIITLVIGGLTGVGLSRLFLRLKASRRANAFERLLPDILLLVATSLRSGFGLPQALEAVARDTAEPAAKEFSRALAETRIGTDITDALDRMAVRMGSTSMRWTVMAIRIQREVGGNLAETLKTTAATLRERESLLRQVRTLSAEGRLSAYILIALPIGMFFYMMAVNSEYISRLWTEPFGLVMSAGAIVLLVVGIFWMRRVVRIEV